MSLVRGLADALRRLDRVNLLDSRRSALEQAAIAIEGAVRQSLSHAPGDDHTTPWLRTGELRASVGHQSDGAVAVVGSTSQVAVYQELGTPSIPPRSFLASSAAAAAEAAVLGIADTIGAALRGTS